MFIKKYIKTYLKNWKNIELTDEFIKLIIYKSTIDFLNNAKEKEIEYLSQYCPAILGGYESIYYKLFDKIGYSNSIVLKHLTEEQKEKIKKEAPEVWKSINRISLKDF